MQLPLFFIVEMETVQFDMLSERWAQAFSRENLNYRLVQLPEIRHSLHGQGAHASKRIRMHANVFSSTSSFAHFLQNVSINQSINQLDIYPP